MAAVAKELSESVRQYSGGEVLEAPVFTKLPDTKHLRVSVTEVPATVLRRLPEIQDRRVQVAIALCLIERSRVGTEKITGQPLQTQLLKLSKAAFSGSIRTRR